MPRFYSTGIAPGTKETALMIVTTPCPDKSTPQSRALREKRLAAGFTLRRAAEALAMRPSYLSSIERGASAPVPEELQRMVELYTVQRVSVGIRGGALTGTLTEWSGCPVLILSYMPGRFFRPADCGVVLDGDHELVRRWNEAVQGNSPASRGE